MIDAKMEDIELEVDYDGERWLICRVPTCEWTSGDLKIHRLSEMADKETWGHAHFYRVVRDSKVKRVLL